MSAAAAVPTNSELRVATAVAGLIASTSLEQLADRLAGLLVDLVPAAVLVGVRIAGADAWRTTAASAAVIAELAGAGSLDPSVDTGVVFEVPATEQGMRALAVGIDVGAGDRPGIVIVAGPALDLARDGETLAAVVPAVAAAVGHLAASASWARRAEYDPATGLLNVAGLERHLAAVPASTRGGVVDLQLGGITELAGAFGTVAARTVLEQVADRLLAVPGALAVASSAMDGLLIAVRGDEGALADQLVAAASAPVTVGRHPVSLRVRAGVAGGVGVRPRTLVERAALARLVATGGGAPIVAHSEALAAGCHERLAIAVQLRQAIDGDRLDVHYQPQVDADGRLLALEALVRWPAADGTVRTPDEFLPVAEQAGLMAELDLSVLRRACRQLRAWGDAGLDGFGLAVNLSASTVALPGLADRVLAILADSGVDPGRLEVEITETAASAEDGWIETLARLRSQGVSIAVDDFGTGYSSLGRLHRLPLDRLKIDRSFVVDLEADGAAVAAAVVALAAGLGLAVLAEGVEDDRQVAILAALGCNEFQGYRFSRPLPVAEVTDVLVRGGCR